MTRFEPLIEKTFLNAARSWRSCPSRHGQRLLVLRVKPHLARPISSTTRGLGAFHGISPEDAVQISRTAASMTRTRNICELVGPLAVLSSCKSEQAHSTFCSESRLSVPVIVELSVMIGSSTFVYRVAVWLSSPK